MSEATAPRLAQSLDRLFHRNLHVVKLGLESIRALLEQLGNPQDQMLVVHVAGTNGKGSVCAMLDSVFRAAGIPAGLYTSPHLHRFNERIRVNGDCITDGELLDLMDRVEASAQKVAQQPGGRDVTFFEFTTALAFEHFRRKGVKLAVVETGMGGRLDATNVVTPLVSIITSIGMDHMEYLGRTLAKIAGEKAGIIKQGCPVICGALDDEALAVVRRAAQERASPLILAHDVVSIRRGGQTLRGQKLNIETSSTAYGPVLLPLTGQHQVENCAVAVAAIDCLQQTVGLPLPEAAVRRGLASLVWPARTQVLSEEPPVILDGAHNTHAAHALAAALDELRGKREVGLIVSFLADKDGAGFMRALAPLVKRCWAVPIHSERAMPIEDVLANVRAAGLEPVKSTLPEALREARAWAAAEKGMVCITGSLYLAGETLELAG